MVYMLLNMLGEMNRLYNSSHPFLFVVTKKPPPLPSWDNFQPKIPGGGYLVKKCYQGGGIIGNQEFKLKYYKTNYQILYYKYYYLIIKIVII